MEINKVFVIIVTYNGKQWYDRCFSSLQQSEIPLHVIVVDNASTDDSVEYITAKFPEIYLIESKENLGFGQGNNKGIRYALDNGADYVFLLNQDAWIEKDTISKLLLIHKDNLNFGILSPMHLNAGKTAIEKGIMHYIADYRVTSTELINDLYFNKLKDVYVTKYVNAAAWLLPKKTLDTVGGFDPIFFHYGEDDNYIHRVLYHGFKIGICPKTCIVHDTEERVIDEKFINNSRKKSLLVKFSDINNSYSIYNYYFSSIGKAFLKLIKIKPFLFQNLISDASYILKLKKYIDKSRKQNLISGRSWL